MKKTVILGILMMIAAVPPLFSENAALTYLNRILNGSEKATDKSIERLSSGRILLVDDPSSYAIYETLEKHIRGLDKTIGNQTDMLSYYQLEDAMFGTLTEIVQRIRKLELEKSNGILSDSDRGIIDSEIDQLYSQIADTLRQAEFNRKQIFTDILNDPVILNRITRRENRQLPDIDRLLDYFIQQRASVGAKMKGLEYMISGERVAGENMANAQNRSSTDFGTEMTVLKQNQLLMLIQVLMLKQTAAK